MEKKYLNAIFCVSALLGVILLFQLPITVRYDVATRGLIIPAHEWSLARTIEGNLISAYKDNIKGSVNSYGVTEFQRGDVVEFKLNPAIYSSLSVRKGDTIGVLYSNEEERKLKQLLGQYEILNAELKYHTTGKKVEDVQEARRKLELVKQKLDTQRKLMDRTEALYLDSLISNQKYEVDLNELRIKEINKDIAEAQYNSAITGDKVERAGVVMAKIRALDEQIEQVRARLNYFTLISPITGMVVLNRGLDNSELLINIVDTSSMVVIVPLELSERSYVNINHTVELKSRTARNVSPGKIASIDNVVQVVDNKQAFFATAIFENQAKLIPGTFTEVLIAGDTISLWEYMSRIFDLTLNK
jgi:multidrug efflux pump subunit AcrA (membrane-fusion protein)